MDRRVVVGVLTAAVLGLAACSADSSEPGPDASGSPTSAAPTSARPLPKVDLTLGVYGTKAEIAAYRSMVTTYNLVSDNSTVSVKSWPSRDAMVKYLRHTDAANPEPDVFLASRADLGFLLERRLTRPVDELLDERSVDFGDGYSRNAIEGFSADRKLQCMPYAVSPAVVFYNTDLVDFTRMAKRGLDVPSDSLTKWNLSEFTAAATFASRPRTGAKGIAIDPTLDGIAPFVYAGGGSVFGDGMPPTSLAFSSGDTRNALSQILPVLRDPSLTLTKAQQKAASPVQWFERGKLGMVVGTRSLVPELRRVKGLHFDVLPIPSISTTATVGDVTGLCLAAQPASVVAAADFLAYATSLDAVRQVTRTGYLVPTNQQVALSEDFLQTDRQPAHSSVFNTATRAMVLTPYLDDAAQLDAAVEPDIRRLLLGTGSLDLDKVTERIDADGLTVLAPPTPTPSPSSSPSS